MPFGAVTYKDESNDVHRSKAGHFVALFCAEQIVP
jgi:hypothetical protein